MRAKHGLNILLESNDEQYFVSDRSCGCSLKRYGGESRDLHQVLDIVSDDIRDTKIQMRPHKEIQDHRIP